jgi:hypothetical protein
VIGFFSDNMTWGSGPKMLFVCFNNASSALSASDEPEKHTIKRNKTVFKVGL